MQKLITSLASLFIFFFVNAQNTETEKEIRLLEEKHIQAILQMDSAFLRKLWPSRFMVNNPGNRVVVGGQVERVMSGSLAYSSYKFEMEQILIRQNLVVTMGNETVVPVMGNPKGGQTIKRRYTHIWQKENDNWVLIARHANEVCQ